MKTDWVMILNGWKEIASYLGRGVRTVQRWEGFGLPVRRPVGGLRSSVITTSEDLDRWIRVFRVNSGPEVRADQTRADAAPVRLLVRAVQQRRREQRELCNEQHRLVTLVTAERKAALKTTQRLLQKIDRPRNRRSNPNLNPA